jgi:hypothetical protein
MGNDYRWASATSKALAEPTWHLISLPRDPADPNPATVFAGIAISGNLYRWDPAAKSYVAYYSAAPGSFGDCQTGEGYWLHLGTARTVSYYGVDYHLGQHLPLATVGWHLIGHPFATSVALSRCSVKHNATGVTKTVAQAQAAGWIGLPLYEFDPATRGYRRCGFAPWDDNQILTPWRGYWLRANVANLTLNIPTP